MSSRTDEQLSERAARLAEAGADPRRVELLERARRFKRSWIEMAEALVELRKTHAFEAWGYKTLHEYCEEELLIRKATVDKLTVSYSTIERHAPEVLGWDGVERPLPTFDTVDYFARVMGDELAEEGEESPRDRAPGAVDELRSAIFDEGLPLSSIRKQFNPVFFGRTEEEEELDRIERAESSVRRLVSLLPTVPGLSRTQVKKAEDMLGELESVLLDLRDRARNRADRMRAGASLVAGHARRVRKRPPAGGRKRKRPRAGR